MKELCLLWCDFCQDLNFSEREIKADNLEHTSPGKHWILEQPYGRSCQVKGNEDGKTAEGREKGGSGAGQPQHMSVRTPESLETGRPVSQDRQSSSDWAWHCNPSTHSLFLLPPLPSHPPYPRMTRDISEHTRVIGWKSPVRDWMSFAFYWRAFLYMPLN